MIKLMKALCVGIGLTLAVVVSAAVRVRFGITPYLICAAVVAVVVGGVGILGAPNRTLMTFVTSPAMGVACGLVWPPVVSAALLLAGLADALRLRVASKIELQLSCSMTALETRLAAMGGDQVAKLIVDFVETPNEVRERLQGLGWSEMEVIHFGALIKIGLRSIG